MKQYKTIQVQKQVPDRIICNCCGREIQITKQHPYPEYVSIRKEWGYDSPYDGEVHEIDLCQDCYAKWIRTFKFAPQVEDNDIYDEAFEEVYDEDH